MAAVGDSLPSHKGSPRAGETAEGTTETEQPVSATPTLQPVPRPNVDAVTRAREEMGTTPIELAAEHLEDARTELIEAMKCLDSSEDRDLHYRLGNQINDLDDLRSLLAERSAS